jgi:hypothetical protein
MCVWLFEVIYAALQYAAALHCTYLRFHRWLGYLDISRLIIIRFTSPFYGFHTFFFSQPRLDGL